MVRNWKSAPIGTSLALAAVALGLYAFTRPPNPTPYHLANGVEVTPVEVKPDDTLALLDARLWKFDVTLPDTTKMYDYTLNLCRNGKVVAQLGGIGSGPGPGGEALPRHVQVTVGMVPLDDTFSKARRVKYSIRTYGAGSKGVFPNPFVSFGGSDMTEESAPDDLVYLMSGGGHGGIQGLPANSPVSIALKIEPFTIRR